MTPKMEAASIEKNNGQVFGPYAAVFEGDTIFIVDPLADVDDGNIILRKLASGESERSIVTEVAFYSRGPGRMGAHFQLKFRRVSSSHSSVTSSSATHRTAEGNHSKSEAKADKFRENNGCEMLALFDMLVEKVAMLESHSEEKGEVQALIDKLRKHPLIIEILSDNA